MSDGSLRHALRDGTRQVHADLDGLGAIDTRAGYERFLRATFRFRQAVEPGLQGLPEWPVTSLTPLLADDLEDLGLAQPSPQTPIAPLKDVSTLVGGLYVLEGSNLGARVLFRHACALGLTGIFGARHLAQQAADHARWPQFLSLLNRTDTDVSAAVSSAQRVFALAYDIYSEQMHDLDPIA